MKKLIGLCLLCLFGIIPGASAQFNGGDGDGYDDAFLATSFPAFLWQFAGSDGDGYDDAFLATSFPQFLWQFTGGDGDGYDDAGFSLINSFAVNATADPGTGACDAAECTLREAITGANANASPVFGGNMISFDIAGAGPHTIQPASALPTIIEAVNLNGTTEPDFAGTPVIELDGSSAGADIDGLHLTADGSTIRGLVINRFTRDGIRLTGASGNTIAGNYLGTNVAGTAAEANSVAGINLNGGATGNTIGGATVADRNLLSGNTADGIILLDAGATGNMIQGNYVGTNAAGTGAVANGATGVVLVGAVGNTVGAPGAGNLVSGNAQQGIFIGFGAENNTVEGNTIGADVTNGSPLGNGENGIMINQASGNLIGGAAGGANNIIAYNIEDGVVILDDASLGNTLRSNNVFANGELGLDLGNDGFTANDPGDADASPNKLQNFPVVTQTQIDGGDLMVTYRIDALPANATYPLVAEFFRADDDQQEGEAPLGSDSYDTADHNGCGTPPCTKTVNLGNAAALGFSPSDVLVTTATDDDGNTSEFSPAATMPTATRYVSTGGDDTANNCADPADPCATLAYAVAQANAGDTLNLAAGTYAAPVLMDKALTIVGAGVIVQ